MVKMGRIWLLLTAVLLLTACPDGNLLLSGTDGEGEILVQSISAGSIVETRQDISLSLVYPPGTPPGESSADQVRIILEQDGTVVSDDRLPADKFRDGSIRSIRIPRELDPGLYNMKLTVERDGEVLSRNEIPIFHVTDRYRILGISSYPPSINPGSTGMLQAHLDVPEGSDPYLRWSMGSTVIAEGYLSQGPGVPSRVRSTPVTAPATEGVYPVSLELFPEGPPKGTRFSFSSPIRSEMNLFVSSSVTAAAHELSGGERYYSLLNLRGDRIDRGSRPGAGKDAVLPVGERRPVPREGNALFGYQLDGTNGLKIEDMVLPVGNGRLLPFSLILKVEPQGTQEGRTLFTARGAGDKFLFRVSYGTDGRFEALLSDGTQQIESRSDAVVFKAGEPATLILSIIPESDEVSFLWFLNGVPQGAERSESVLPKLTSAGESLIGGESGFRGIVDEFGIYFRDTRGRNTVYAAGFLDAMKERYGADLIYAEGFDGIHLPDGIILNGSASLHTGSLHLNSESSLVFPRIAIEEEVVVVRVVPEAGKNGRLNVSGAADAGWLLSADLDGTVSMANGTGAAVSPLKGALELRIMQRVGQLFLLTDSPDPIPLGAWEGKDLEIALAGLPSGTSSLKIDSVSIRRESLPGTR